MPFEAFNIRLNAVREINSNRVCFTMAGGLVRRPDPPAVPNFPDLVAALDDALGKEKPHGKLVVIAGRPHCN